MARPFRELIDDYENDSSSWPFHPPSSKKKAIKKTAMADLDQLSWKILNATADDCENLEEIYGQVHDHFSPGKKQSRLLCAVADRIEQLVRTGLLMVEMDENGVPWADLNDTTFVWRAWFRMTPEGRQSWERSELAHRV